jgi:hypothetical protein
VKNRNIAIDIEAGYIYRYGSGGRHHQRHNSSGLYCLSSVSLIYSMGALFCNIPVMIKQSQDENLRGNAQPQHLPNLFQRYQLFLDRKMSKSGMNCNPAAILLAIWTSYLASA